MKSLLLIALFIVNTYSLTYNWPTNPTHVSIIKPHLTALFGPQSYQALTSIAKVAVPANFCDVPLGYDASNRILLVERGNCTFYQKAQNAIRAGATAIIIADTNIESFDMPLRMGYPVNENPSIISIPVVSTSGSDFIAIQKLVFSSNSTLWITVEQAGFDGDHGHGGSTGGVIPGPHSGSTGNSGPVHPTPAPPSNNPEEDEEGGDHEGRGGHGGGRSRSVLKNGMIIAAIVISSCICGFCMGKRCGNRARYCRRQQALASGSSHGVAPVPLDSSAPSTVHGGERYVQVDMESAPPVAYYGEQEMALAPVPSAPPHDSSYPSSAPSNYA